MGGSASTMTAAGPVEQPEQATAAARACMYAALSALTASPPATDGEALAHLEAAAAALPYPLDVAPLAEVAVALREPAALAAFHSAYSSAFEVGERGPPLPIRAELAPGVGPQAKEEVVRFYEHFGYELGAAMAWQPDHLSVLLEFLHYLAWQGSGRAAADARRSLQRAQRDFLARHVLGWLPQVSGSLAQQSPAAPLTVLFAAVAAFARADHAWLAAVTDEED